MTTIELVARLMGIDPDDVIRLIREEAARTATTPLTDEEAAAYLTQAIPTLYPNYVSFTQ